MIGSAVVILFGPALTPQASAPVLYFEGLQDQEEILDFYNGGTGNPGSTGTDYGVSFGTGTLFNNRF